MLCKPIIPFDETCSLTRFVSRAQHRLARPALPRAPAAHAPPPSPRVPLLPRDGGRCFPEGLLPCGESTPGAGGPGTPSLSTGAGCVPADPHPPASPQRSLLPGSSPAPPLSPKPPSPPRARQRQGSENAVGGWRRPSHRRVPGSPPCRGHRLPHRVGASRNLPSPSL